VFAILWVLASSVVTKLFGMFVVGSWRRIRSWWRSTSTCRKKVVGSRLRRCRRLQQPAKMSFAWSCVICCPCVLRTADWATRVEWCSSCPTVYDWSRRWVSYIQSARGSGPVYTASTEVREVRTIVTLSVQWGSDDFAAGDRNSEKISLSFFKNRRFLRLFLPTFEVTERLVFDSDKNENNALQSYYVAFTLSY